MSPLQFEDLVRALSGLLRHQRLHIKQLKPIPHLCCPPNAVKLLRLDHTSQGSEQSLASVNESEHV